MSDLLGTFKSALVFFSGKRVLSVDSWTFKLCTVMTSSVLLCSSVAVSARQFFGEPIRCDSGKVRLEAPGD